MNKVRFIHFRNIDQQPGSNAALIKGGATIAWFLDDSGDIRIGAPAVCSPKDHFVKSRGRALALDNLHNKPLVMVVQKEEYLAILDAEIESFNSMKHLNKSFRKNVIEEAKGRVADDVFNFVNIGWFEAKVRQAVIYHENHVYTANGQTFGPIY